MSNTATFMSSSIMHPRACSHSPTRCNHLSNQSLETTPGVRLIVNHSLQQANFSRSSVRFALLEEESPHLEIILILRMTSDATQSFATHQSSQTNVHRFLQEPLRISTKPRQRIRELECKVVETIHSFGRPTPLSDPSLGKACDDV